MNPLARYQKLKSDLKSPLHGLLFSYRLLKGHVHLKLKDGSLLETNKGDLPIWKEYFQPKTVRVELQSGLFRITPIQGGKSYWIQGGNDMISHRPDRLSPQALRAPFFQRLQNAEKKVYSQHGEDGVIQEIFKQVPAPHKFIVEFGAHDGVKMSNSRDLILNHGWKAFLIEADPRFFKKLRNVYRGHNQVQTLFSMVTEENINLLFRGAGVPKDFEVLSVDVDSIDYYLWNALAEFRPRLVIIECNAMIPPNRSYVVAKEKAFSLGGTSQEGASFKAFVDLAKKKGYTLVYTELTGANLFFLDNQYLKNIGYEEIPVELMYQPPHFGELTGLPTPSGRGYA